MEDCLFCKIARGEIPCSKVYEDELVMAFRDIAPQAPEHVLIIPRQHIANLHEAQKADDVVLARLLRVAAQVAEGLGLQASGYRLAANCGAHACQSVAHLHLHILGGAQLAPRMG